MVDSGSTVEQRRSELLAKGYRPGAVEVALDWAVQSADGMATFHCEGNSLLYDTLYWQWLDAYLARLERYLEGVGAPSGA